MKTTSESPKLIVICNGKTCQKEGGRQLLKDVQKELSGDYQIITKFCFGYCGNGPIVYVLPDDRIYYHTSIEKIKLILKRR